jgi:uncharacterized protein YjlB
VSETEQYTSGPTGLVPNSGLPLLVHRDAISGGEDMILETFRRNGWSGNWTYPGLFDYGHFHSSSHECLSCARGWMDIRVFGRTGSIVRIRKGDVAVLPAGVSHAMAAGSDDVLIVGGYPDGCDWDTVRDDQLTEPGLDSIRSSIQDLPVPPKDPATGEPIDEWSKG